MFHATQTLRGALLATLFACAAAAQAQPDLAAPDAAAAVAAGKITLIDIRTPPEWKETGVAKGANLINMLHPQGAPGFTNALLDKVKGDKNAPIALICRTGNRTTQVQRYLQSQGFTQVYNVKEGMAGSGAGPGWLKRGLPVDACSTQC
ncbi:rhodanese-like domain-containing protein [Sulfuritalea sp.]|uniref:rhodanese-like domain-containing protein n=1 Tax=Sulfuritalea sp. TaxID=2480090 RepID=UPI001AD4DF62|nr:rhodanese-like domain-containing protein [Sulfuritalea sp.]MBN8475419.1 rhodanese-like domain-containing protein [Sulfuritalea sp.]